MCDFLIEPFLRQAVFSGGVCAQVFRPVKISKFVGLGHTSPAACFSLYFLF
jgi:hypothetical protein